MTANLVKAKGAAFKLHQEFGVRRPVDIRVEDIAMAKNVFVAEDELGGAEARLIREGSIGMVRINASIAEPGRKRFAASHELGHWQMHEKGNYVCTPADMADYQKSPRETEANTFAAEFLMPTFLFRPLCANKAASLELVEELNPVQHHPHRHGAPHDRGDHGSCRSCHQESSSNDAAKARIAPFPCM